MSALLLVVVGFALILGQDDFAKKLVHALVGLVIVLSFAPCVLAQTNGVAMGCGALDAGTDLLSNLAIVILLSGIGWLLWRLRSGLAKRRDDEAKRWSSPRDRAMPPPPRDGEHDERRAS